MVKLDMHSRLTMIVHSLFIIVLSTSALIISEYLASTKDVLIMFAKSLRAIQFWKHLWCIVNLLKTMPFQATSLPEQPSQPEMSQTKCDELIFFGITWQLPLWMPKMWHHIPHIIAPREDLPDQIYVDMVSTKRHTIDVQNIQSQSSNYKLRVLQPRSLPRAVPQTNSEVIWLASCVKCWFCPLNIGWNFFVGTPCQL